MAQNTINPKKEWAKMLFLHESMSQKEIAETVGASVVSINKWVKEWAHLKLNLLQTREERLASTLQQLELLDKAIREGAGYPDSKQADIRRKLTADLEALEQDASIRDVMEVGKRLLSWYRSVSPDKSGEMAAIYNEFIKSQAALK